MFDHEKFDQVSAKFERIECPYMHEKFEDMMNRIDQILDEAGSAEEFMQMKPEFVSSYLEVMMDVITSEEELDEVKVNTLFQMAILETQARIQEHELQAMGSEQDDHSKSPEAVKQMIQIKSRSFVAMMEELKHKTYE